jgi:hypothetical protein
MYIYLFIYIYVCVCVFSVASLYHDFIFNDFTYCRCSSCTNKERLMLRLFNSKSVTQYLRINRLSDFHLIPSRRSWQNDFENVWILSKPVQCRQVYLRVCEYNFSRFCYIFILLEMFCTEKFSQRVLRGCEFRENRLSECHTLFSDTNEFISTLPVFIPRFM